MLKCSVVLSTYNGEKYIKEQLDSLYIQSRQIDEVIISDDCSHDNTVEIIENYVKEKKLNNWKLYQNETNKGWKKNFKDLILVAQNDVIFPCDQDDIWDKYKIEKMMNILENNNSIHFLASDFEPLYESGARIISQPKQSSELLEQIPFDHNFCQIARPGCTMAFRKEFIHKIKPIWEDWYPHDAFLWTEAVLHKVGFIVHDKLIMYRRHSDNATLNMRHCKNVQISHLKRNIAIGKARSLDDDVSYEESCIITNYIDFAQERLNFIEGKKVIHWFKLIFKRKYYTSLKQMLGDWFYFFQ